MRIIFATGNAGKMREIREIMADMDMEICSMKQVFPWILRRTARRSRRMRRSRRRQ